MFGLGVLELVIILVVVVLLFGARRLPELGSSLGGAIRSFRSGTREAPEPARLPEEKKPEP